MPVEVSERDVYTNIPIVVDRPREFQHSSEQRFVCDCGQRFLVEVKVNFSTLRGSVTIDPITTVEPLVIENIEEVLIRIPDRTPWDYLKARQEWKDLQKTLAVGSTRSQTLNAFEIWSSAVITIANMINEQMPGFLLLPKSKEDK